MSFPESPVITLVFFLCFSGNNLLFHLHLLSFIFFFFFWVSFPEALSPSLSISLEVFVTHRLSIAPIILYLHPNFTNRVPLFYLGQFYRLCNLLQLPKHPSWSYENKYTLRLSSLTPWGNILLNTVFGLSWNTYISTYFLHPQPPQSSHLHFQSLTITLPSWTSENPSTTRCVLPDTWGQYGSECGTKQALEYIQSSSFWLSSVWNWKVRVKVIQSCPALCNPMDYTSMEFSAPFTPKHILVFHHHTCWNLLCTQSSIN